MVYVPPHWHHDVTPFHIPRSNMSASSYTEQPHTSADPNIVAEVEVRAICKCAEFDGTDGRGTRCASVSGLSGVGLLGLATPVDPLLTTVANSTAATTNRPMSDQGRRFSVVLYAALVGNVRRRSLTQAKRATCSPGLELSRRLVVEYERTLKRG